MQPHEFMVDWPTVVLAHVNARSPGGPQNWNELAVAWEWEPWLILTLIVAAGMYRRGVRRLWLQSGQGRGLRRWEVASFWGGWWTLVVALVSPLHPWGRVLFSAHMTQHELLMVAAAPLLVLGRPMVAFLFALPRQDARQVSRVARNHWVKTIWRLLTEPLTAWAIHAVALWFWHVPRFFQATLTHELVHDIQHLSFFGSALLFWWALIHGRAGVRGFGVAVLYLFTTMAHTGALGALITLADTPVYPAYDATTSAWSLSPLEDQQLGGVIMWVPAGLVYVVAALALVAGWMRMSDRSLSGWIDAESVKRA
jgi:cytochrome c oxidase assembly factor CtaG